MDHLSERQAAVLRFLRFLRDRIIETGNRGPARPPPDRRRRRSGQPLQRPLPTQAAGGAGAGDAHRLPQPRLPAHLTLPADECYGEATGS
ncbi:hypothetical protein GCM10009863_64170 [Streptomyces axinellae]|uniref:Uncharacterized protein n=1 Tax=Streptomyces axinellae TaxID=552788 RepID=A0ABP6D8E5_9ACTN